MSKKYIIAVSGGVDSVALLHKLAGLHGSDDAQASGRPRLIVAHFDHGMRAESAADAVFVAELAHSFGLSYVSERAELGLGASEADARTARYTFLRKVMRSQGAEAIITAHHQDDVIETMLINMMRGTGPRGLVGYSKDDIIRPYIETPKAAIVDYAQKNSLQWCEDSTNNDTRYLRNKVRAQLVPRMSSQQRAQLLQLRRHMLARMVEIDNLSKSLLVQLAKRDLMKRAQFVVLPFSVQKQVIATYLRLNRIESDKAMIERMTLAVKLLPPGKHIRVRKKLTLVSGKKTVLLKVTPSGV